MIWNLFDFCVLKIDLSKRIVDLRLRRNTDFVLNKNSSQRDLSKETTKRTMSSSFIFSCCKHGTDSSDCPICQRILLVWFLKQINPGLLKEMVRHIASFLPRERSLVVCSMCNITSYSLEFWKSHGPRDLDGTFVTDDPGEDVRICCGYNFRYDNDDLRLVVRPTIEEVRYMQYEEFCDIFKRQSVSQLAFTKANMYEKDAQTNPELHEDNFVLSIPQEIAVYRPEKEYVLNVCDNCIECMIQDGIVEHKEWDPYGDECLTQEEYDEYRDFGEIEYDEPREDWDRGDNEGDDPDEN